MKNWPSISGLFAALVVLSACGASSTGNKGTPGPPPLLLNLAGNWEFNTTSTAGNSPLTIAGSINQNGSSLGSALHVNGSNCFDHLSTVSLKGTLTGSKVLLTSTSVSGQVTALSGNVTDSTFTGTYTVTGGCANGDHGDVTGLKVVSIGGLLSGTFTTSTNEPFAVSAQVTQASPSSVGSFGISGTVTFTMPCLKSGTIIAGTFPSGSFILGTSVVLEIKTDNGVVNLVGTANHATAEINGDYKITGGSCDQIGTAYLANDPWGY